jgi:PAS domain-containing protein
MDGVEIADEIRKRFYIPVIFVTAHADRETLDRARITEPFGYIVKPFHGIDFRVQIEVALWRHKMEQKLRVSQAWLSATFQNVADGLIATDEAGNIALMNKPAGLLTGWDAEEAKGRPLEEVFRVSDEITGRPVTAAPAAGLQTFILSPRGDFDAPIIEAEISENRDEGKAFGVIIAFRDITERRKAERRDRQIQKMNALTLMATGLGRELAESQSRMDESIKFLIENSQGETARLLWDIYEHSLQQQTIVQQLIALGRTDAGRAVPLDLNAVLSGLREPIRKTLGVHRTATLNLRAGIPLILADPALLRENLLRLITDCRHATAKGAAVEISTMAVRTKEQKPGVQLVIRDDRKTGSAPRERVFDPYYQSLPGKRNPGFTLALVCQFVALAGGTIEVETIQDEGSAYILRFPAATGILAPEVIPAAAGRSAGPAVGIPAGVLP